MNLCFRSCCLSHSDRLTLRQLDYTTDPSENHRTSGEEGRRGELTFHSRPWTVTLQPLAINIWVSGLHVL